MRKHKAVRRQAGLGPDIMLGLKTTTQLCEVVNTPRSLTVAILIRYSEWDQLVNLDVNPQNYECHSAFADDYLVSKILSKHPGLPTTFDLDQRALASFYEGEQACLETNRRLFDSDDPRINLVAHQVQSIVGHLSHRDLDTIASAFSHGPGAAVGLKGNGSVQSDKYRHRTPTLTSSLTPFVRSIVGPLWALNHDHYEVVDGNTFTTVPKNAKTNRGICIEPLLNVYCQLGVGTCLKKRLRSQGIDLTDQSRNQMMAATAASNGLATIDLSLASDTVSMSVVYRLLPPRWFELLDLLRSPCTTMPCGRVVKLEKFSSMGNGFTFELETLIFLAIARAVVPTRLHKDVSCYGDDIICPQAYAPLVIDALEFFGFKPNRQKTFLAGRFFESCGTDWFDNCPVRPPFLKESEPSCPYAVKVANLLRHYALRRGYNDYCCSRFRAIWDNLIQTLPPHLRLFVPYGAGDVGIEVSLDELGLCAKHQSYEYFVHVRRFSQRSVKIEFYDSALMLSRLASHGPLSLKNKEAVRGWMGRRETKKGWHYAQPGFCWG